MVHLLFLKVYLFILNVYKFFFYSTANRFKKNSKDIVRYLMVFFVLSFFPRGVLDKIWDLIESVSEDFPTYSSMWVLTL